MRKQRTSAASACPSNPSVAYGALSNAVWILFVLIAQLLLMVGRVRGADNTPMVGARVRVSPPLVGNHSLMDLSLDPENPLDMFACGYRYSGLENEMVGFVYRSQNGGHSWDEVLKDSSSAWVSEESCAAGGGHVFFMAERALLEHGKFPSGLPLQQQGEMHVWNSSDEGNTWDSFLKRGWLDHTAMAVDWTRGAHRGRMYLFGQASRRVSAGYIDEIQLITSDDGKSLHGPVAVSEASTSDYAAGYASSSKVLPDGSVLAAYLVRPKQPLSKGGGQDEAQAYIEVFGTSDAGETLAKRVEFGPIHSCLGAMPAMDVNRANGVAYLVWGSLQQNGCKLFVSWTRDGGHNWSAPRAIVENGRVPAIAVNDQGIVGLLWLETEETQCWKFAASSDGGVSFSSPVRVSRCLPSSPVMSLSQSARDASPEVHAATDNSPWSLEASAIGFSVIAARDGLIPDRIGLTADPSGAFHALWPEPTDQNGALWSASITVGSSKSGLLPDGARDISHEVVLEFADSGFDSASGVYSLNVTVMNVASKTLKGQIFLRLDDAYSRYFKQVSAVASDNDTSLGPPLWVIWPKDQAEVLGAGQKSSPRRLSFRLREPYCNAVDYGDLLSVKVKAFAVP